jgi:Ig-like domain-containing protein
MRRHRNYIGHLLPMAALMAVLTLAACGPAKPAPTPTMSVDAIYTAAFHTLTAQQATQLALTPPTPTATSTLQPTVPPPPTLNPGLGLGSPTAAAGAGAQACDSSVYVNDVTIPDGTVVDAGKKFTKTWTVMNNGTCTWSTSYKLVLVGGEALGGSAIPVPASVPPGQQTQISVVLTAPTAAGNYTGSWQLQNASSQPFGNIITVVIKVGGASSATNTAGTPATVAPSATATP